MEEEEEEEEERWNCSLNWSRMKYSKIRQVEDVGKAVLGKEE